MKIYRADGTVKTDGQLTPTPALPLETSLDPDDLFRFWSNDNQRDEAVAFGSIIARGTFTASITTGGGSVTLSSSANTLSWERIGSLCHIFGQITVQSVSSPTGDLFIAGLPFPAVASLAERTQMTVNFLSLASSVAGGIITFQSNAATTMRVRQSANTTSASGATMAALIQAGTVMILSGFYRVA